MRVLNPGLVGLCWDKGPWIISGACGGGHRGPFHLKRAPLLVSAFSAVFTLTLCSGSCRQGAVASPQASSLAAVRVRYHGNKAEPVTLCCFHHPLSAAPGLLLFLISMFRPFEDRQSFILREKQNNQQQRVLPSGRTRLPTPSPAKAPVTPTSQTPPLRRPGAVSHTNNTIDVA